MTTDIANLWKGKKVIIIGDIMLDEYIQVDIERISPEGFLPVMKKNNNHYNLGGAANVALNLKNLGIQPILFGMISNDIGGDKIRDILKQNKIENSYLSLDKSRPTTTKTRFISGNNQIFRLDEERTHSIDENTENSILSTLEELTSTQHISAIVFQDYNKGLLTHRLITEIIKIANEKCILTLVDPKDNNFFDYKNVSLFKPNLKEIKAKITQGINPNSQQKDLIRADIELRKRLRHQITMITLSENGIYTSKTGENHISPAKRESIVDVCGAGDTVLSIATAALIAKMNIKDMTRLCNIGGGQVCCKKGVQAIVLEELLQEFKEE